MPTAVVDARAQGQADLALTWRGGWALPTVDAQLKAPTLTWQPPGDAQALGVRQLQLALQGGLDQATLSLSGQALQGERSAQLDLHAQGGRSTPQAPLAHANWRLQLNRLAIDLRDPQLGAGRWRAQLAQPVNGEWRAAQGRQTAALTVASGELSLTSPEPARTARVLWDPVRWQPGQLSTAGRIVGLPMAWAEAVAGDAMRQAGVSGDVVFNGQWNAQLGQQLKLEASLTRTQGDLTVIRKDAATGIESRIAAGLREARLGLRNDGERVNAQLRWDSAQLGTATGDLATRLAASRGADGQTQWTLPDTAPLDGQLKLQLPRVNAWSILAPPGWRLHGSVNADVKIAGTLGAPLVTGNLGADDLAMRSVVDGLEFGRGRLRARLAGQKLLLDEFSLRGAGDQGGRLLATGEAGLVDGAPQASLAIQLQRLRASIRADRQVTVSGQVDASLNGKLTRVTGQLGVDHALILLPEDSAPTLGSDVVVRGAKDIATRRRDEPLGNSNMATAAASESPAKPANTDLQVQADVKLNLGDDFRLRGMGIDTKLKGELTLAANGPLTAMPRLTGDVRTEGGTFKAYNQNLTIQRGLIRFSGAIDNPTLDIRALRPNYASEQRVGVQVQGTALLPVVTLYSNPSLSDTEALAWLLLGRAAPDTGAEAAMLQSAAMAVLGGKSGTSLASRFGLDELSFGSGNGSTSDASVTLGKRLSDNLYASYERSLSGVTGTLMIYLELSRRWTVRGQAGEDSAIDLLFRLSYD
ncbi:translocation/assembly module TamB domain-containing protein [Comamonas serinivorans]